MDRPLRIIHCFRSPIGGVFRHVRDLAREQTNAGHEVGLVCDSLTGGAHEERLFDEIRPYLSLGLTRVPIRRSITPSDIKSLWRAYKEIKALRPDVLHGHSAKGGVVARVVGTALRVNKYRVARFYTAHGGSLHFARKSLHGRLVHTLERIQEFFTDGLVFICDYERRNYVEKIGEPRTQSRLIYNGIEDRDYELIPAPAGAVPFLFLGMLWDLKGPDLFIEAFAKAERRLKTPLSALMIGDGPDRDRYRKMMVELGLGQRITMIPAMPIKQAFSLGKSVVVPSRKEALPYIVLEALAAGKSVIAADVGGVSEILGKGSEAIAQYGDSDDLARVMVAAVTEPDWHDRVMPSQQSIQAIFSSHLMSESLIDFYRDALAHK